MNRLTEPQARLLAAIELGAILRHRGWQELRVEYGVRDPRNYTAREGTLVALRDRGLITLDRNGARVVRG